MKNKQATAEQVSTSQLLAGKDCILVSRLHYKDGTSEPWETWTRRLMSSEEALGYQERLALDMRMHEFVVMRLEAIRIEGQPEWSAPNE